MKRLVPLAVIVGAMLALAGTAQAEEACNANPNIGPPGPSQIQFNRIYQAGPKLLGVVFTNQVGSKFGVGSKPAIVWTFRWYHDGQMLWANVENAREEPISGTGEQADRGNEFTDNPFVWAERETVFLPVSESGAYHVVFFAQREGFGVDECYENRGTGGLPGVQVTAQ